MQHICNIMQETVPSCQRWRKIRKSLKSLAGWHLGNQISVTNFMEVALVVFRRFVLKLHLLVSW